MCFCWRIIKYFIWNLVPPLKNWRAVIWLTNYFTHSAAEDTDTDSGRLPSFDKSVLRFGFSNAPQRHPLRFPLQFSQADGADTSIKFIAAISSHDWLGIVWEQKLSGSCNYKPEA